MSVECNGEEDILGLELNDELGASEPLALVELIYSTSNAHDSDSDSITFDSITGEPLQKM